MNFGSTFLRGINYWPADKAMYWWKAFDIKEAEEDFRKLRRFKFSLIRFFLNWEDFQPRPDKISYQLVDHLKRLADLAYDLGIYLMPTFFCGHMSGVNWMPEWMLISQPGKQRFPIYSNGRLSHTSIRNFYDEEDLITAQLLQIRTVCGALNDHPAIFGYDLGNESSNCVIPYDRQSGQDWLRLMSAEIKMSSPSSLVTLGMHAEDLEQNRHLWPQDAALYCDFLSMHGYPFYLSWVENPFDYWVLPFLGIITRWLGNKAVLFQEFGVPTYSKIPSTDTPNKQIKYACPLWSEGEAADYYQQALLQLEQAGMLGGMAWCFTDYQPALWNEPPLRDNPHERQFGLFRYDGSAKLSAQVWRDYVGPADGNTSKQREEQIDLPWLNSFQPQLFYDQPQENLARLFTLYKKYLAKGSTIR